MRSAVLRGVALVAGLLALAAACSSSGHPASSATTTTTSPLDTPNSLPYAIQEKVAVGNGWLVDITNVHRHYVNPSLPSPKSGREYVAVDLWINNHSTSSPS